MREIIQTQRGKCQRIYHTDLILDLVIHSTRSFHPLHSLPSPNAIPQFLTNVNTSPATPAPEAQGHEDSGLLRPPLSEHSEPLRPE
jgi:hypothetical protein